MFNTVNKRYLLILSLFLATALVLIWSLTSEKRDVPPFNLQDESLSQDLDLLSLNLMGGGPKKDGIPPIEDPRYVSVDEAEKYMDNNDVVFLIEATTAKIFPRKIMVWHEVVNDDVDGIPVSLTYCPLTGSAIGFVGNLSGYSTTLGTSGKLVNSNLVLYDRATNSNWPQILGTAIDGSQKGRELTHVPIIWTTWELAKTKYPGAKVLSEKTGFMRPYGSDPYGSYQANDTYYQEGSPMFPVLFSDDRLPDKEVVVGVNYNDTWLAFVKKEVMSAGELNYGALLARHDPELDTVHIFQGNNPVDSIEVMWFGWVAFHPFTEIA
ncbi:MAG: DUF3179 domain-containing protein [Candidatus Altiarchaeota archaeon]|nr:DUF3179 domain-containing protein [Candidatus Altiarchaeota archaeon]